MAFFSIFNNKNTRNYFHLINLPVHRPTLYHFLQRLQHLIFKTQLTPDVKACVIIEIDQFFLVLIRKIRRLFDFDLLKC